MAFLLFPFFSFWLPQIVLCVRSDCRQPLRPEFALGTSAARLALPLYIYGCPTNLLRVAPNPALCAALVGWVGLQCGVLLVQHYWGPRCFIPKPVSRLASRGACMMGQQPTLQQALCLRSPCPPVSSPPPHPSPASSFLVHPPLHPLVVPAPPLRLQPAGAHGCARQRLRRGQRPPRVRDLHGPH